MPVFFIFINDKSDIIHAKFAILMDFNELYYLSLLFFVK